VKQRVQLTDKQQKIRFPIELRGKGELRRGGHPPKEGRMQLRVRTVDASSSGLLFRSRCQLYQGALVKMTLEWPVTRDDLRSMKWVVTARIVRIVENNLFDARIVSDNFYTIAA
jgi:hypothetical protein